MKQPKFDTPYFHIQYFNQHIYSIKYKSQNTVHGKYHLLHISAPEYYFQWVSAATCYGTRVPSSGSVSCYMFQNQRAI